MKNEIARIVVDVCYQIHRKLGPGLLESVYVVLLLHELLNEGLQVGTKYRFQFYGMESASMLHFVPI